MPRSDQPHYIPEVANESVWLQQSFFNDTSVEKRLSPAAGRGIKHIAFDDKSPEKRWITNSNNLLLQYDGTLRSLYLRWSVICNGLNLGMKKYVSKEWTKNPHTLRIGGLRLGKDRVERIALHDYPGHLASELHGSTIPIISGWGLTNMYACLEEMIMLLFKVFYFDNPENLLQGEENKPLKALFKARESNLEAWKAGFEQRFQDWRFKKIYQGIKRNFENYITLTKLEVSTPGVTFGMYGETLNLISLIRNSFIHGATTVSKELSDASRGIGGFTFSFQEGEPFQLQLDDMSRLEMFCDDFTTAFNHAFFDRYMSDIPGYKAMLAAAIAKKQQ